MDNTDMDLRWRKRVVADFVGYAFRELRGDDMSAVRMRTAARHCRKAELAARLARSSTRRECQS
jgi:hypothetical protein